MNITILTYGSRGDVQPFIPLSLALMARGHKVILAAPSRFRSLVEEYGITFYSLEGDPEDLSRRFNDVGYNFFKQIREMMSHALDIAAEMVRQTDDACKDADLIIHTFAHLVGAHTLAREKNIPDVHIQTFPTFSPTGDYPNVTLPNTNIRFLNRLTHTFSLHFSLLMSKLGYEQVRRKQGWLKRKLYFPFKPSPAHPRPPILCAWSPSLLPPSNDWESTVHVTGYYFLPFDESYSPPNGLDEFLITEDSPVCVSFGSMVNKDVERIDEIVREAIKRTGNRAVILSGWGSAKHESTDDLLYLETAPHDWLLPKCKMLIHHGGAGTTSAALLAGIPQVVIPFTADQPFWGRRVHAVGVGPEPILVKKLSVDLLVQAIVEAESDVIRNSAQVIGQAIRAEGGVDKAIDLVEDHVVSFKKSSKIRPIF